MRFLALTASPGSPTHEVNARFGIRTEQEIEHLPEDAAGNPLAYPIRLRFAQLSRVGGPGLRVPYARTPEDLALVDRLMRNFPALGDADGWGAQFGRELNATEDRQAFGSVGLPVIDGKHLEPFRVRVAEDGSRIDAGAAALLLPGRTFDRLRLGYRDVSGFSNRQSLIAALVPAGIVTTHTILSLRGEWTDDALHFLCGVFNSYVLNTIVRMLMGSHLTASLVAHLPVPRFSCAGRGRPIVRLARRMSRLGATMMSGAALQAEVAHLYGLERAEFRRILEGFPLVPAEERMKAVRMFEIATKRENLQPDPVADSR